MSKSLFVAVSFVTLLQKKPSDYGPTGGNPPHLEINGIQTSKSKYLLHAGFGDPGENPQSDNFDFAEFSLGFATFTRPSDYNALGTYQSERLDGTTATNSYRIWIPVSVPDEFFIPGSLVDPGAPRFVHDFWDDAQSTILSVATAEGFAGSDVANLLNASNGTYATLKSHLETQFQILKDGIDGRVDPATMSQLSENAANKLLLDLGSATFGIPGVVVSVAKNLVTTWLTYSDSSKQVQVGQNNGSVGFVQAGKTIIAKNSVGSSFADSFSANGNSVKEWILCGAGDDTVSAAIGNNTIVGGTGVDTLDLMESIENYVNLRDGICTVINSAVVRKDNITGIENVSGSGGVDHLFGNELRNVLKGEGEADQLEGLGGNDFLVGGGGSDLLNGGEGIDTALYDNPIFNPFTFTSEGIIVSLVNSSANTGEAEGDLLVSVENISATRLGDTIEGDVGVNVLNGRDGDDVIRGGGGGDR